LRDIPHFVLSKKVTVFFTIGDIDKSCIYRRLQKYTAAAGWFCNRNKWRKQRKIDFLGYRVTKMMQKSENNARQTKIGNI
jgi:hypothetical protein